MTAKKKAAAAPVESTATHGNLVMSLTGTITIRTQPGQANLPAGAHNTVEAVEQAIKAELGRSGAIVRVELVRTDK